MHPVGIAAVGFRQPDGHAFITLALFIAIRIEFDPIQTISALMGVEVIGDRAADAGGQGAADNRAGFQGRTPAQHFAEWNGGDFNQ
ncbi:hypothetical protein ID851_19785 [Xenorhabdus sp. 5]|nr:hypothetical protein [Xenorhabdus sp. 5]